MAMTPKKMPKEAESDDRQIMEILGGIGHFCWMLKAPHREVTASDIDWMIATLVMVKIKFNIK